MKNCLGIDPSLNAVGLCLYHEQSPFSPGPMFWTNTPPLQLSNQFQKMQWQCSSLNYFFHSRGHNIDCVAIEIPYVQSFGRSLGGHQSANMWAVYSLFLDALSKFRVPVACFQIAQLRSLIHKGKVKKPSKQDTLDAANKELMLVDAKVHVTHEADAYFIAKYGLLFWDLFDNWPKDGLGELCLSIEPWTENVCSIFLGTKEVKTGLNGMIWRPGDAWYDFRQQNPVQLPDRWQQQRLRLSPMQSST